MKNKELVYFIGIKGTGMAALACILHDLGKEVVGSDLSKHFFTEEPLHERKIPIYEFDETNIPDGSTVIIGNAFDEEFSEVKKARMNKTLTCYRYHQYLGEMMKKYHSISVAGSHGKTTTTGLLVSMLEKSVPTGYLIGDGTGEITAESKYLCVESCEYRRHFLSYFPDYAIITNIEIDHVDYFKSEEEYRKAYQDFIPNVQKAVLIYGDDKETRKLQIDSEHYWYGEQENDDFRAVNFEQHVNSMEFDLLFRGEFLYHFTLPFVGRHYLWNSLGVIGIGILEKLTCEEIERNLSGFKGVKRRFVVENFGKNVYIDDYAHHPTEVSLTIDAAKSRYPGKKIVAIFKPHRASRVLYFADQFATALSKADSVYLCDFTSIDDQEVGIDIDIRHLQDRIKDSKILTENEEGAIELSKEGDAVYLFMSSKDIYGLATLLKRYHKS